MNALTKKDKLALQVSLALVAGMFSIIPVAQGAPVLDKVVSGGAVVKQKVDNVTTVTSANKNNIINWKDFSVAQGEKVIFDATKEDGSAYTKTNNYLNVVTGNGTSYINGEMKGGNNVYLVNPQGVIMGKNADIDVGNLYVSTKKLTSDAAFAANGTTPENSVVLNGTVSDEVVNMGQIQANSVYAEGTNIRFLNTKQVLYKPVTTAEINTTDAASTTLLSSSNGSVTLKATGISDGNNGIVMGTGYVHVGFEATANSTDIANYHTGTGGNLDTTKQASTLGYNMTAAGTDQSHDYALVHQYVNSVNIGGTELQGMNNNKSLNYMLAEDIELSGSFTPIGDNATNNAFKGNFDGNYFKVKSLKISDKDYAGLFGKVEGTESKHSLIMNVGVEGVNIEGTTGGYAGGVAGYLLNADLINVYNKKDENEIKYIRSKQIQHQMLIPGSGTKTIYEITSTVGGIVGCAENSNIDGAYNTGYVRNGAGLVGKLVKSTVSNSYNAGVVHNNKDYTTSYNAGTTAALDNHYAIVDKIDGSSKLINVYGSGEYEITDGANSATTQNYLDLAKNASSNSNITNAYVINTEKKVVTAIHDTSSANVKNNTTYSTNVSGQKADNFAFFGAVVTGTTTDTTVDPAVTKDVYGAANTKTDDGVWRIYDGNSLPLLRNFLKANGKGTIPVSYSYSLYVDDNASTAATTKKDGTALTLTGSDISGSVSYTGYYIGITGATTDSVRDFLDTTKIGSDSSIRKKAVGDTLTAFYSTDQDGYDLAGDPIEIVKRKLGPSSSRDDIDKVYDGSKSAAVALGDNLLQKIDLRDYDTDPGYGIVQIYDSSGNLAATQEKVALSSDFIIEHYVDANGNDQGTYYKNGPNVTTNSPIVLALNDVAALTGDDADSYELSKADFSNFTFSGDITPRPVEVSLKKSTGISKVYDGQDYVVEANTTTIGANNAVVHSEGNISIEYDDGTSDSGLMNNDGVAVIVSDAYYSTDKTAANRTKNANNTADSYKAGFALAFSGDSEKLGNYKLVDSNGDEIANNTLWGTGNITKRNVTLDNIAFLDSAGNAVDNKKTYDFTSAYTDAKSVNFSNDGTASMADAVNKVVTTGVVETDLTNPDNFKFGLTSATFYKENETDTANTVADAKKIKYVITTLGDASVLQNYTLNNQEISSSGSVNVVRDGEIEKRNISVGMVAATANDIDKTYDGKAEVIDRDNKGYLNFIGTGASSTESTTLITPTVSDKGYVGYATTNKDNMLVVDATDVNGKSLNDGTTFTITAKYTTAGADDQGSTTAAKDVYLKNGVVSDKKIDYIVTLDGTYAANYTINGVSATTSANPTATLEAAGTINQRKITGITFADVEKTYDGSDKVGEVNGVTQTNNKITVSDVSVDTTDGATISESMDTILGTTGGVVSTAGITGTYGKPGTTTFEADAHARDGVERQVKYSGVSNITGGNPNYVVNVDDVQYGKGVIKPLVLDTLSTEKSGKITKVYDGTKNVVGGYQVQYEVGSSVDAGDVIKVTYDKVDEADVKSALGTITGSGLSADGTTRVTVTFGANDYVVDATNSVYNSTHVDEVNKISYAVGIDSDLGDYSLADTGTGYTKYTNTQLNIANGAKIDKANTGLMTPRYIYTQEKGKQSKTYDGGLKVKDSNGNELSGEDVVTFNAATTVSGLVADYTDPDNPVTLTNVSKAVYSADSRTGAAIKDANIYTDDLQTSVEGAKSITYTVRLSDATDDDSKGNLHGDYKIYKNTNEDAFYAPGDTYEISGHNIKQADLTVSFGNVSKKYDTNAKVVGVVTGSTDAQFELTEDAVNDAVSFATQNTSAFTAGTTTSATAAASDVGTHTVKYDLVASGIDLKNYRLVASDGTTPLTVTRNNDGSYNVTAYGTGVITPLTVKAVVAAITEISKVYDGNTSLTYTHAAPDYDSTQIGSDAAEKHVGEIVFKVEGDNNTLVDALTISTGYTVNDSASQFNNADVGTGKTVTYSITVDGDIIRNLEMESGLGTTDATTKNFTFTQDGSGSITAKNIYAYLNSDGLAANPTKTYDGGDTVDVTDAVAKSYVTINGLVSADSDKYTVTPKYESKDVAVDGNNEVVASQNYVDYTVALTTNNNSNYNLYTVDKNSNIFTHDTSHTTTDTTYNYNKTTGAVTADAAPAVNLDTTQNMSTLITNPTKVLVGKGTITPKEITISATLARKIYDADEAVKFSGLDTSSTDTEKQELAPVFTLNDLVADGDLTVATTGDNAITGEYVTYDKDQNMYVADANVELDGTTPTFKAVRYSNVAGSLTAGNSNKLTNYKLVDDATVANAVYDSATDTLLFTKDAQKGKIIKRSIDNIVAEWADEIRKEYDATTDVLNPTEHFKVYGVSTVGTQTVKTNISYNLVKVEGKDQAYYATKDAGGPINVTYQINGLKTEELQNFELNGDIYDPNDYIGTFDKNIGYIDRRVISGKVVENAKQEKVYDGTAAALSDSRYFNIDDDDLYVLALDGKNKSVLTVTGEYAVQPSAGTAYAADKNAYISPTATANGDKAVKFTIGWAANQADTSYQGNYTIDTKSGGGDDGTGTDYIGKGDIRQRIVYVKDSGGRFQEKTYDGTTDIPIAPTSTKFSEVAWSGSVDDETGIIDDDVHLTVSNISGHFVSPDVVRDSSGTAQKQAVVYSGDISLADNNLTDNGGFNEANNYYLEATGAPVKLTDADGNVVAESNVTSNYNSGQLVITEDTGGIIKPQPITISVAHSPTKDYDASLAVTGDYDANTHYATASNLTSAAADGASIVSQYAVLNASSTTADNNGNILHIDVKPKATGTVSDEVLVTITKDPVYTDKNASTGDKVTTYNLSWTNGNYELVGQTQSASAGSQDDTFTRKSYTKGEDTAQDTATGVLTDYAGTINPLTINIESMDSSKTYDGTTGSVNPKVTVTFDNTAQNVLVADGATNVNSVIQKLGLTVENGTYGSPTQEALARAIGLDPDDPNYQTDLADPDNQAAMAELAAATDDADAAFDENSDPFKHNVLFSGISITNGNYKLANANTDGKVDYDGTGTINRASITAKGNNASVKVGEAMPGFSGKLSGFASQADSDYYNGLATWGPGAGVTSSKAGTNPVYGWYRNLKSNVNLGKNYILDEQQPGTFTVVAVETPINDGSDVNIGYVEKPVVPDSNVYQNVSKDTNNSNNRNANAAIQYGESGAGIVADKGDSSSSGTIAIELVEVVNLLRGDVASDGTMSLTNTDKAKDLTVESTDSGYLSVGSTGNEGSIGIETKDDLSFEAASSFGSGSGSGEDSFGVFESTVGNDDAATVNKEGSIALESEGDTWTGEAEISISDDRLVPLNGQTKDEEDKDGKKKNGSAEGENKEGEAAITYGDVA